jgi:hypothetical protein
MIPWFLLWFEPEDRGANDDGPSISDGRVSPAFRVNGDI